MLVALLCCVASSGQANIPRPSSLLEAFGEADQVLLVRIVSGRTLDLDGQDCGARYVGSVVRSYKGKPVKSQVEFGPYHTLQMGAHYLVFLGNSQQPALHWLSSNGFVEQSTRQWFESCKSQMAPMSISFHSAGAMLIDESAGDDMDSWKIYWNSMIAPPSDLKMTTVAGKTRVQLRDFSNVVNVFKSGQ